MGIVDLLRKILPESVRWKLYCFKRWAETNRIREAKLVRILGNYNQSTELPIKVAFIAQMPEVWDKQLVLFESMQSDPRFEPYIVVVPPFDFVNKYVLPSSEKNSSFYIDKYGKDCVIALGADADFKEIKDKYDISYVFYDRPYNFYLPRNVQTDYVVKLCKPCMINYCTSDWAGGFSYYETGRDTYFWFASNDIEYNVYKDFFKKTAKYNKAINVGYPAFQYYKNAYPPEKTMKILWTPRWSYDSYIGGSHFMEYIDSFIELFSGDIGYSLVIRPHPMMFDNFILKGIMTQKDIDDLIERCKKANITFDKNRDIHETFKEIDFLVSDYSSILSLYMTTNRPVIYCDSRSDNNEIFDKLVDVMYAAENWEEIEKNIRMLIDGEDPMREKREAVVNELLLKTPNAVEDIKDILANDHKGGFR